MLKPLFLIGYSGPPSQREEEIKIRRVTLCKQPIRSVINRFVLKKTLLSGIIFFVSLHTDCLQKKSSGLKMS